MNLDTLVDKRADYTAAHVANALFLLSEKPLGRFELMKELDLAEAPVKTLLKNLAKRRLIRPTIEGAVLTPGGKAIVRHLRKAVPSLPQEINAETYTDSGLYKELHHDRFDVAIVVKSAAHRVRDGVEQRDIAVRAGAIGCTTLVQKSGKLVFPRTWYETKKEFAEHLKHIFSIHDSDVVVICFGPSRRKTEHAALSVALSLA